MNSRDFKTLEIHRRDPVLAVTLNRPKRLNAMNSRMVAELREVATMLEEDRALRALFLDGAGASFCSGADLKELWEAAKDVDTLTEISLAFGQMLVRLAQAPALVVAVVHGPVMGGGLGLACVADMTLALRGTRFAMPEVTRGIPPAQILPFVVRRVGHAQAARMALSGEQIRPREAARIGLAHEVFEDRAAVTARLESIAAHVSHVAPGALKSTRALLHRGLPGPEDLEMAARVFAAATTGAEAIEGARAFAEGRKPNWMAS